MSYFFNFYKRIQNQPQLLLESKGKSPTSLAGRDLSDLIATSASTGFVRISAMGSDKAEEFTHLTKELANDDGFLSEFSDKIGTPQDQETEEQFVERAKKTMSGMLLEMLSNKNS